VRQEAPSTRTGVNRVQQVDLASLGREELVSLVSSYRLAAEDRSVELVAKAKEIATLRSRLRGSRPSGSVRRFLARAAKALLRRAKRVVRVMLAGLVSLVRHTKSMVNRVRAAAGRTVRRGRS